LSDPHELPQLLTMDALAKHLGVTHRHVRRLVDEKRVPYLKVGRLVRFDPAEVAEWLRSTRVPAAPSPQTGTSPPRPLQAASPRPRAEGQGGNR
jgi:excisionase family DNA binding protein